MLKAAIFDMDGLMFDTEAIVYRNWHKMMTERGYEYNLDIYKQTVGKRKTEVEFYYRSVYGDDFPYRELADMSRGVYIEGAKRDGVPVKKGLYKLLDFLKSNNFKLAVATSTSRETTELNLSLTDTARYFDAMVCGNEVKNGKPHPEVFLTASKKLGFPPENCIAFEDSINGIKSAHSAGNVTVMVPDMLEPTGEILPMIDCLCKSLDESINFIIRANNLDKAPGEC